MSDFYDNDNPAREEPDCGTCGDTGQVEMDDNDDIVTGFGNEEPQGRVRTEGCPGCNPSPEMAAKQQAMYEAYRRQLAARIAAGEVVLTDEPPF